MAKRDYGFRDSEQYLEPEQIIEPEQSGPISVKIRLMKDLNLTTVGEITGNTYTFNGAGSEVYVDTRDAEKMLKRKSNSSCCPGSGIGQSTPYFELVRE